MYQGTSAPRSPQRKGVVLRHQEIDDVDHTGH
jgi:hypothetical protein